MTDNDNGEPTNSTTSDTRELTVSRVIEAPPTRVYEAFVDPDELAEWYHPPGFKAEIHDFNAEEGGSYRISMTGTTEGNADYSHSYTGTFEELVPGERIVQTEVPGGMDGEMTVTITFDEVAEGTEVTVLLEIPSGWPDEAIGGWEAALGNLAEVLDGN